MVAHYNIQWDHLVEELNRLKAANQKVLFIVPELVEDKSTYSKVVTYTVIFEEV